MTQSEKALAKTFLERAMVQKSIRLFAPCPECNGDGFIETVSTQSAEYHIGNGPVRHTYICGECHGTGTMIGE